MIQLVGFYAELGPENVIYVGSILDAVRSDPADDEARIVTYLEGGLPLLDIMEKGRDVISGDRYIDGCSSILTDGTWIWRLDLPYYAKRYHLELDAAFLEHVRAADYTIPEIPPARAREISSFTTAEVLHMSPMKPPPMPEWPPKR
jgi:hypothetical protein